MNAMWIVFNNLPGAVLTGLMIGVAIVAIYVGVEIAENAAASFCKRWGLEKPKPKPREYRVVVEDEDGWPLRSYKLPAEVVGRVLRDIDRIPPA